MAEKKKVLFVCTGNIFRSMSAEKLLKAHLKKIKDNSWIIDSAGTIAKRNTIWPSVAQELKSLGIKDLSHKQKRINKALLKKQDVIVAMAQDHLDTLKNEYGINHAILFNQLAKEEDTSIRDITPEGVERIGRKRADKCFRDTVKYLHKVMPKFKENLHERFFLFQEFLDGNSKFHRNKNPFIILYETKNTVAFMSIDIPSKEDGHILVIPKKRYPFLEDIPSKIKTELIESVNKIGKVLKKHHGGYNLLLNQGHEAGQYIFHNHFHLIPRNKKDNIKIEVWGREKISPKKFLELNKKLKEQIEESLS